MVEREIKIQILAVDNNALLAFDKREPSTQLQKKPFNLPQQPRL
jgi:hypothetical protein